MPEGCEIMARTLRDRNKPFELPSVSANGLKLASAALMAVYYFSISVVQGGILHMGEYTAEELNALLASDASAMSWATVASLTSLVGAVAVPIFAFLTAEGALHTSSMKRYVLSVLAAAVISEVPYDLAVSGQVWNMKDQNSLWTVLIALLMLWLMRIFDGKELIHRVLALLFTVAGCFWAVVLNCKFGGGFVLLTAVFYVLRDKKGWKIFLAALISFIYATGPLGLVPVGLYSGERRGAGGWGKYVFYVFYPVMLTVFALWVHLTS